MKSFMFKEFLLKQVVAKVKTQTRRTHGLEKVNENPNNWAFNGMHQWRKGQWQEPIPCAVFINKDLAQVAYCKPKYQIGDICYLKENYAIAGNTTHHHIYQSDYDPEARKKIKWKSKMMMPAVSARFKAQVTGIRVERLQDISEYDAIQEGVEKYMGDSKLYKSYHQSGVGFVLAKGSFQSLWFSINGIDHWNKNPWVFVYEFKFLLNG